MVCGLVWGIGLRRLGCGCGRRLVTGSCVIRETTHTGCPWSRPRVSLSIYLSRYPNNTFAQFGYKTCSSCHGTSPCAARRLRRSAVIVAVVRRRE